MKSRCEITGRPRGYLRKFKVSRIKFRELAHQGQIGSYQVQLVSIISGVLDKEVSSMLDMFTQQRIVSLINGYVHEKCRQATDDGEVNL